ncbi:MAG: ABC transporter permease [Anaerolineae bacterium]|nr:ABC transporter permease [Anaerolineae bacterium]
MQTYWGAVGAKLLHDKITMAALFLGLFMVAITLAAPWIGHHLLGFDPTDTNLRNRKAPPTWFAEGWAKFQDFSRTCQGSSGCAWPMLPAIVPAMVSDAVSGFGDCLEAGPGECHWLGTDMAGRDVLTRAVYGGRISLRIGAYVASISIILGVTVGLISGYYAATFVDDIVNAVIMTLGSIPLLFLLIILAGTFPIFRSPEGLAFLLGIFGWMGVSRLIRGQIFSIREREYIAASRAIGSSIWRIMFRHMLPNVTSIIIVIAIFDIAGAIIAEAGLSYLGVGIGPPNPSWGNMMQGSLGNFTDAPWLVLTPGLFIFLTTLSIYLIGDGLRDALDPWVKNE